MKYFIFLSFCFCFLSCNTKFERTNDIKDVEYAESITMKLYERIHDRKYSEIFMMADDSLNVEDLKKVITFKDSAFGKIIKVDITEVKTTVRENSANLSYAEYTSATRVKYEKAIAEEIITFVKYNNGEVKLKVYTSAQK